MSDLRKMARDAGFNTEFDDYVIDHWQRFEKFARLINAAALVQPEPPQRKPLTEAVIVITLRDAGYSIITNLETETAVRVFRIAERAHGIGGEP